MQDAYRDVIVSLGQAIDAENAYNLSAGLKKLDFGYKIFEDKIYYLVKTAPVCWI